MLFGWYHHREDGQWLFSDYWVLVKKSVKSRPFGGIWRRPARLDYFRAMWLLETRRLIIFWLFWLKIATFQFLVLRRVAHFSRVPFAMWAAPLPRDMLMYLLVPSRIICVSCFGFDFLSFSLSISSFNSIISSCFGECWNTSFIHAIRLDTQLFYLY